MTTLVAPTPIGYPTSTVARSELEIAETFAASVARDGKIADETPFASDVKIEVLLRNPIKRDFVQKFLGSGVAALSSQTAGLFSLVGRPQDKQCKTDGPGVICQFTYSTPENGWMALLEFENGKVSRVTYMYLTRQDLQTFQQGS